MMLLLLHPTPFLLHPCIIKALFSGNGKVKLIFWRTSLAKPKAIYLYRGVHLGSSSSESSWINSSDRG
jgi:hypothetical protein